MYMGNLAHGTLSFAITQANKKSILTPTANSPEHEMQASLGPLSQLMALKEETCFTLSVPFTFG